MKADATSEPGRRMPAPEPLRLVQSFVNSNDREGDGDSFTSAAAVTRWLRAHGFRVGRLDEGDRRRVLSLREALRAMLLANNGLPLDDRALALVNTEVARTGDLELFPLGPRLEPRGSGLDRVIGQLLAVVVEAMVDGNWLRLKACRRDVCQWVFYDHSRNRSGSWCTMDICGNRVKTSAYWRRNHPVPQRRTAGR